MNKLSIALCALLILIPLTATAQGRAVIGIGSIEYRAMGAADQYQFYDPTGDNRSGDTGAFVDMLATALVKTNKFNVVERDRVDAIVGEQSGIAAGSSQANFDFQGADRIDYILLGAITEYGVKDQAAGIGVVSTSSRIARMAVDIRILDVESGSVMAAETISSEIRASGGITTGALPGLGALGGVVGSGVTSGSAASEGEIMGQVMRQTARGVVNLIVSKVFPIRVVAVNNGIAMLNYGDGLLSVGDYLVLFELGEEFVDPDTGEVLGSDEVEVGAIRVTETNDRFSKAVSAIEGQEIIPATLARLADDPDGKRRGNRNASRDGKKRGLNPFRRNRD